MIPITRASGFPFYMQIPGETYQLQEDISTIGSALIVGADNITVDLNGKTIFFGSDDLPYRYGIALPPGYPHVNPVWSSSDLTSFPCGKNTTIINGMIEQVGNGVWCGGIYRYGGRGISISGVTIALKGDDSRPILLEEVQGPASITSCTIDDTLTRVVTNRHQGRAAIDTQVDGFIEISYCTIIQSPQWGIRVACRTQEISSASIHDNVVNHYTTNTNGYGIGAHMSNVDVYKNTVATTRGRGIHMEGGADINVYGNIVDVMEEPEWDEYDYVTTHGIKLEGCKSGLVTNNTVTVHAIANIPKATCSGSGVVVSTEAGSWCAIRGNTFTAIHELGSIYNPDDYGLYATPIEILATADGAEVIIEDNIFISNDRFLVVKEYNPTTPEEAKITFARNTFKLQGTPTGRKGIVFHMANFDALQLVDNIVDTANGVPDLISVTTGWPWNPCLLTFMKTFSIRFRDPLNANMIGAVVSFITPLGSVASMVTDGAGRLKLLLPVGYIMASEGGIYYPVPSVSATIKWLGTETTVEILTDSYTLEVAVPVAGAPVVINVGTNGTNMPDDVQVGDVVTLTCLGRLENQPFMGTVNTYMVDIQKAQP